MICHFCGEDTDEPETAVFIPATNDHVIAPVCRRDRPRLTMRQQEHARRMI